MTDTQAQILSTQRTLETALDRILELERRLGPAEPCYRHRWLLHLGGRSNVVRDVVRVCIECGQQQAPLGWHPLDKEDYVKIEHED